jgi:hypothetical protein
MQINHLSEDDETGLFPAAHTESSWPMGLTELPATTVRCAGVFGEYSKEFWVIMTVN